MSSVLPPGFPGRPISDNLLRAIRHEVRDIMDNKPAKPCQHEWREMKSATDPYRDDECKFCGVAKAEA